MSCNPKGIWLVAITYDHFDHADVIAKHRATFDPKVQFAMPEEGWAESLKAARKSIASVRNSWTMIKRDLVLQDAQSVKAGDVALQTFKTPGHTFGTVSFAFHVRDGVKPYQAFTIGG